MFSFYIVAFDWEHKSSLSNINGVATFWLKLYDKLYNIRIQYMIDDVR